MQGPNLSSLENFGYADYSYQIYINLRVYPNQPYNALNTRDGRGDSNEDSVFLLNELPFSQC